jgi:protease II
MAALGTASVGGLAAFLGASAASTLVIGARRAAHTKAGSPPVAERRPATYKIGNVPGPKRGTDAAKLIDPPIERSDDLFWLRDDERKDPKVLAHVRAENAYTEFKTSHLTAPGGSVDKLYAEFRSRMKETDAGVPYRKGPFSYYSRTVQGQSYPIHCRRPATVRGGVRAVGADAAEEILLDENAVAAGHKMCDVQAVEVSPDQAALAFAVDFSGYETYSIKFQRLAWREAGRAPGAPAAAAHVGGHPVDETKGVGAAGAGVGAAGAAGSGPAAGSISSSAATFAERAPAGLPALTDEIHGTSGVVEWGADCSHCYYLTMDAEHRPHRLWRHVLGTPQADDECLFEEADERFWLHIGRTLSGDFLVVHSSSKVTGEVAVLPLTARGEAAARAAGAKPAAQLAVTPVEAGDEDGDSGSESGSEGEEDAAAAAAAAAAAKAAQAKRSAAAAAAAPAVAAPSGPRAPLPLWLPIQPRVEGVLYEIEHYRRDTVASASTGAGSKSAAAAGALPGAEDVFVILTNRDGAKNFKVAVAPVSRPSGDNWRDVLPHSRDLYITDIDVHSGFWAVSGREGGYENAWVAYAADVDAAIDAALRSTRSSAARGTGSRSSAVTLPLTRLPARDAVYVLSVGGGNEEYEAAALRFGYSSPTTPPLVCEYRLQPGATTGDATSIEAPASAGAISAPQPPAWAASGSVVAGDASAPIVVLKQKEVPNVDPTLYRTARLWATAKDGTRVPISILYRPDAHKLRPSGASAAAGAATGAKAGAGSGSSAGEECPLAQPAPMLLYAYGSCE